MEPLHFNAICNAKDIVILPDEFVLHRGKKYIKIIGLTMSYMQTNNMQFPYIIVSEKLARLNQQNRISEHLQNPTGKELNYITNTFTLNNGNPVLIPWDYEKTFDIELICTLNAQQFDQDYIIEMELIRNN